MIFVLVLDVICTWYLYYSWITKQNILFDNKNISTNSTQKIEMSHRLYKLCNYFIKVTVSTKMPLLSANEIATSIPICLNKALRAYYFRTFI